MKVLWISNVLFPEAKQLLDGNGELRASGGWMLGASDNLLRYSENIKLGVVTVTKQVETLTVLKGKKITYYLIPYGKGNRFENHEYNPFMKQIKNEFVPDLVHIHGTEYSQGLAYVNACGSDNVVVSIQGLKSAYYYYYYGLTTLDILRNITIRDILFGTLFTEKKRFKNQSKYEIKLLKNIKHIIGRTSWDKARVWAINPNAEYHFCNETLRSEFYDGSSWNYDACTKHSIFLSQAMIPLKGLHIFIKALPIIKMHYPDVKVRIAGADVTRRNDGLKGKFLVAGYGKFILSYLKRFGVNDIVKFTGNLNAEQMKKEYLKCNVFVCPSAIENSPNSLGEAQLLGTPVVASYAGGIPDMMKGDEIHLYRFSEVEMLAKCICDTFAAKENQTNMKQIACERHCGEKNTKQLITIYNTILHRC